MMERSNFKKLARISGYLFFLVLPFQINFQFFGQELYGSAFFNPFLSHFIYIGDIFLFCSFLFLALEWALGEKFQFRILNKKVLVLIGVFLFSILLSLVFSVDFWNSFFYFLRFLEFFGLYLLIVSGVLKIENILKIFIASVSFVALLGIGQFIFQTSLGFGFLGEPIINPGILGVAKFELFGEKILRSYGTFPHPNLFGAYLVLNILFSLYLLDRGELGRNFRKFLHFSLVVSLLALIFTFSRTAILALILAVGFYFIPKFRFFNFWKKTVFWGVIMFLLLVILQRFLITDNGMNERLLFLKISKNMFLENPMGVGIGNFTDVMQQYTTNELLPWNFQPVHNIYLLLLNEIGVLGFASFVVLIGYYFWFILKEIEKVKAKVFLFSFFTAIFIFGFFDHYLISLYQGQALLFLMLAVVNFEEDPS